MALQIMKIFVGVTTTTVTDPADTRFFYVTLADIPAGTQLSIDATDFLMDDGNNATALPDLEANNSYYNVYINGVLQMEGLSTYTAGAAGSLVVDVPAGGPDIPAGTPVVLEVMNFAPSSTSTVET
jgi:hypothetical protein